MTTEELIEYIREGMAQNVGDYYLEGYLDGRALLELLNDPLLGQDHAGDLARRKRALQAQDVAKWQREREERDRAFAAEAREVERLRSLRTVTLPSGIKVTLP